jgi:hypothetical protein
MQRRKRLRPTTRTPAAAIVFADAHLSFQHTLWPAIALAIGRVDHADRRAGRDRALEKNARGKRLVVWMRSEEHHAGA